MKRFCSLGLLVTALGTNARAQSFRELMNEALANNPQIQSQEETLRASKAQVAMSYSPLYPKLSSTFDHIQSDGDDRADALTVRADQMLFNGGTEYSAIASKRGLYDVSMAQLEDARDLVRYDVAQSVLNGSFAAEKLRILQSSREIQLKRLEELRRRFRLGQTREPDLIQAEVEFQKLERQIVDARGLIDASRRDLSLVVRAEFATFNFPDLDQLISELRTTDVIAPRADFGVRTLQLKVEAARFDERTVARSYVPTLSAYAQAKPYRNPESHGNAFDFGIQAQWTWFEGFKTPNEIEVAAATRRKLEIELQDLQFSRQKNIAQLKIDRENTILKLRDLKEVVARAEKALRIQQSDYRRGLVTALEAQASIQNVLDLNLEQAELRYKMGQLRADAIKLGALP